MRCRGGKLEAAAVALEKVVVGAEMGVVEVGDVAEVGAALGSAAVEVVV